jgi:DNA-binding transcriptional regulator YhcF (GntR family)
VTRQRKVKQKAREVIENGKRPSARLLAEELEWSEADVHRCLNILEKRGEVESYRKEVMKGKKMRMVGLNR